MSVASNHEIKLDDTIYHGQDELRGYMSEPEVFRLAFYSNKIKTNTHAVLINKATGLYWVFSLEKATLVRAGNIFSQVTPEMIVKGGFPKAVLCANPEIGGTVLVAAQDEAYFMTEKSNVDKEIIELQKNSPGPISMADLARFVQGREEEISRANPYIVWYRIYPENGKVEKLSSPPEGGTLLRDGATNDVWRPMPDGTVLMGWNENKRRDQKTR
jgi:hypothetical protein